MHPLLPRPSPRCTTPIAAAPGALREVVEYWLARPAAARGHSGVDSTVAGRSAARAGPRRSTRCSPPIRRARSRCRCSARSARSRTTSTSPDCRPPPRVPRSRTSPRARRRSSSSLEEAGAIVVGKTNLDQFATGLVGTRSPYGAVPNAFDPRRISGGSSSGSAVAVATRARPFRARHRYRGFRTRAGGSQQHRRLEAVARTPVDARRRAGVPVARLRVDLRADAFPTPRACSPRRCATIRAIRRRARRCSTGPVSATPSCSRCPAASNANSIGDAAAAAAFAAAGERLASLGGIGARDRLRALARGGRDALRRPARRRAACRRSASSSTRSPTRSTRRCAASSRALAGSRRPTCSSPMRALPTCKVALARLWASVRRAGRADGADDLHDRRGARPSRSS